MKRAVAVSLLIAVSAASFAGCGVSPYGSENAEAAIRRYMQDLDEKDKEDGMKCFPEGLDIRLGPMWSPDDDPAYVVSQYDWDLDTLDIGDYEYESEIVYEVKYGRNFESVRYCFVSCNYTYEGREGCYSLVFVTCRYIDRYYVIDVFEEGEAACAPVDDGGYGSFTMEDTASYDGLYVASIEPSARENPMVKIWITNQETGESSFIEPFRVSDFWGICWEKDSYRLWLQSGDLGVICYNLINDEWAVDHEAVRPDYIVSKYD